MQVNRNEIAQTLLKVSKHHPQIFREELQELLNLVPPENLSLFWEKRKGKLLAYDRPESRFISSQPGTRITNRDDIDRREKEKEEERKRQQENERITSLGSRLGQGYDLWSGKIRVSTLSESFITIFPDGHSCKGQEPNGLHLVLPRGETLRYCLTKKEVTLISPDQAEQLDDQQPKQNFFIDTVGVKRKYALVYSLRLCPELYRRLAVVIGKIQ